MISIIIPIYNAEKHIRNCLDSISNQIYKDFEVILVDDGSSDNSGNICDEYASLDSRFVSIHKKNGGVSSARNTGLEMAQGEWIYFVDSDDELYPNAIGTLLTCVSDEIDLVIAGYDMICQEKPHLEKAIEINRIIKKNEAIQLMYKPQYFSYLGYLWIKLFRRLVIQENNIQMNTNIYFNEDRLFSVEYMCKMKRNALFTTIPIYKYYIRPNSAMASIQRMFNPKFITDFEAFVLMKDAIEESNGTRKNRILSQYGIIFSWRRIRRMMKEYNVKDNKIKKYLLKGIFKNVSIFILIRFCLYSLYKKII